MRNKNIYCALNEEKKTVFFISLNGRNYNLFTAPFKSDTVYKIYCNGVSLESVFKNTVNCRQQYVKDNIVKSIKVLEKELEIALLRKTKAKQKTEKKRKMLTYPVRETAERETA